MLKKGDKGPKVKELQELLNNKGYPIDIDGVFGRKTLTALVRFQENNGLTVDGMPGKVTMQKLKSDRRSLKDGDFERAAAELGVEVAVIKAVTEVESRGSGYSSNGQIKILFEGHIFWKELDKIYGNAEIKATNDTADILHEKWTRKFYKQNQWDRLEKAMKINETAALKSASYGMFQIMGFNHKLCGFPDVQSFVDFNKQSEGNQLLCFVRYCLHRGLDDYLRELDWAGFAKRYNGPGYEKNKYDTKMAVAYEKYS